ncbi:MAG: hypothetical protein ACLFWH_11595 [Actinomycetota bacterium]
MSKPNTHQVARAGQHYVAAELHRRGANARFEPNAPETHILASNTAKTRTVALRIKTKRKGNWHAQIQDWADLPPEVAETRFWIFVDLTDDPHRRPQFYIVPERWIQDDIDRTHAQYLERHGGRRPQTQESKHHSIDEERIEQWADRWDLLGLFDRDR